MRFGGSSKFDSTPGGGLTAGPFKSASSSTRVKFVDIFLVSSLFYSFEDEQEQESMVFREKA